MSQGPTQEQVNARFGRMKAEAESGGYHINPDVEFAKDLVHGLLVNEARYGYPSCPCRIASGVRADDLDIICPCDYRDPDLDEHGACYCALYVSQAIVGGEKQAGSIPERRPPRGAREQKGAAAPAATPQRLEYPVWRCKVCGYLCARDAPPEQCPICKARKDRFARFM